MTELERLSKGDDAAALLLQSARIDRAPSGGKTRALAALGLDAPDVAPMRPARIDMRGAARREALLVSHANRAVARKLPKQTAPAIFQSVLAPPERALGSLGKTRAGATLVAAVQLTATVLTILLLMRGIRMDVAPSPVATAPAGIDVDMMQAPGAPRPHAPAPAAEANAKAKAHAPAHSKILPSELPGSAAAAEPPVEIAEAPLVVQAEPARVEMPAEPPKTTIVIPSAPITRPKRVAGRDPQYTREAREARVEGTAVVQCTIDVFGATQECKVLKPLPHMEDELLAAARTWRFSPATEGGKPVATKSSFSITLVLPKN
jgi:protein TonB